jgi:hypothetical protein
VIAFDGGYEEVIAFDGGYEEVIAFDGDYEEAIEFNIGFLGTDVLNLCAKSLKS